MTRISAVEVLQIPPVVDKVKEKTRGCACLAQAAQNLTDVLYAQYSQSIVLVRMFATIPFRDLPPANHAFVTNLAQAHDIMHLMADDTPVLSLLGTHGARHAWNDRRKSVGHVGIPLASAAFVDRIPMMSRLLKEVGLSLDWIDSRDITIMLSALGRTAGVFHVQNATTAVDQQGRKIIAAQDFVAANQVKTVFGLGGGYVTNRVFVVLIVFCREEVTKSQAALFMPLITTFKANTTSLATPGAFFEK